MTSVLLIGRDLDFCGPNGNIWSFSTYVTRTSFEDLVISVNYRSEHMVEAYVSDSKTSGKAIDLESITGFISTTKITLYNAFDRKEVISKLVIWATEVGAVIPDQDKCLSLMEVVFHKALLETLRRIYRRVSNAGLSSSKILEESCRLNKLPRITKQMRKKFELSLFEYDDETLGLTGFEHTDGPWKLSMGSAFFKDDACPYVIVTFGRTGSSKVFSKEYPALSRPGNEPIIDPLTVHADLASSVMSIKAPIPSFQVVARLLTNAHMEALREYIRNTCRDAVKSGLSTQECIDAASSILCEEIMIS